MKYLFSNQFSSLRSCTIRNIDSMTKSPWRISPSLSSIITCDQKNLLPHILQSCPKLERLSIAIHRYSTTDSTSFVSGQYLTHLSIEIIQPAWTIVAIKRLCSSIHLPHLTFFRICSHESSVNDFDFAQLIPVFQNKLPQLQQFQCDILFAKEAQIADIKTIRNLHPSLFKLLELECQIGGVRRIYTSCER